MTYQVFTRTWYKKINGKKVPHLGRKTVIGYASSIEEAREMCRSYNDSNNAGELSRKAEFTSDY